MLTERFISICSYCWSYTIDSLSSEWHRYAPHHTQKNLLKPCDRVWSWWVLFSWPERCWACSLNQGQLSKLSQNMLLWGVNCSHSVSSRNYRSTWTKNRPWSNGIWVKHHSGSSQSCHTLLFSSLKRLQQCDEGFWERVNEHSVNRWLRGQI